MSDPDLNSELSTPVDSRLNSPISSRFLSALLCEVPYAVQLEKWTHGEKKEERYFIPHPGKEAAYLEMDKYQVWGEFVRNWEHIKIICEHQRSHFVVKMLAKYDGSKEVPRIQESVEVDFDFHKEREQDDDSEIDWEEVS
jgi:hypothetical protein